MKTCPICKLSVEKFNQQGHVLPRFLVKKTKNGGRNVQVHKGKGIHERAQSDRKGYLWCDQCELQFKSYDDFAKKFFDEDYGFIKVIQEDEFQKTNRKILKYDIETINSLYSFIISVVLREEVYCLNIGESILGPKFNEIKSKWDKQSFTNDFDILIQRFYDFDNYYEYPYRCRSHGLNVIKFIVGRYFFILKTDQRNFSDKNVLQYILDIKSGLILEGSIKHSPKFKNILESIQSHIT